MLFWIVAAAMTAGVVLFIIPPLLRGKGEVQSRAAYDLEVYRDQLGELDRDFARGLISEQQAAAAKAEIGRRMLAAAGEEKAETAPAARRGRAMAVLITVAIPLGALAVYVPTGRPDAPAQPLHARNLDAERNRPPPNVMEALAKLEQNLAANPNDVQGWALLAQVYGRMQRWQDAAEAMGRAVGLSQGDPELVAAHAEMLTNAASGQVTPAARAAFEGVLEARPGDPRARFYLALARFQEGDMAGALEGWRALMAESPADAPWLESVRARIADAAARLGRDVASVMPEPLPPADPTAGMTPEQRNGMVRGMVASLAAKMEQDPANVEGWIQLARSYGVLGERDKAVEAARQAAQRAPDQPAALMALAQALLPPESPPGAPTPAIPDEATALLKRILELEPESREALWLLGVDAANAGRAAEATALWSRLLAQLDPAGPDHAFVRQRIEALGAGG